MHTIRYSQYNCFLACIARFLDEHPDDLIKELGHDGKSLTLCDCTDEQLFNPEHKHPVTCQSSFHPQEFYPLLMKRGRLPVLVSRTIVKFHNNSEGYVDEIDNLPFFAEKLRSADTGIILGWVDRTYHSVLKVGNSYILDPKNNFANKRNIDKFISEHDMHNLHHILLVY